MDYNFSTSNFTFWDFIVNIIPGTSSFLLFVSLLPAEYISTRIDWMTDASVLVLFFLLITGHISGWVIHEVARLVDGFLNEMFEIPNPVKEKLDRAREDQKADRDSIERRYLEESQLFFANEEVRELVWSASRLKGSEPGRGVIKDPSGSLLIQELQSLWVYLQILWHHRFSLIRFGTP